MRVLNCDVVVVGAGPAGSMTARSAAEGGVGVLLLEEHPQVGMPVHCAEGLSTNGIRTSGLSLSPDIISQEIKTVRVYAPNRKYLEISSSERSGYIINREIFDQRLADRAVESGAELLLQTKAIRVIKEERVAGVLADQKGEPVEIRARVVVGADGFTSVMRKTSGLGHWYPDVCACAQFKLGGLKLEKPEVEEFYLGSNFAPGGYAWVFPKSREVANVGLGVRMIHKKPALEYLKDFVKADPRFREAKLILVSGGVTPVSGMVDQMTGEGIMLVGDAAGQLIPVTGAGVHAGMAAGKIAGEVAAKAVQKEDVSRKALIEYERRYAVEWGERIRRSRKAVEMLDKFSDNDLNDFAEIITERDILDLANGQNTASVLGRLVLKAPLKIMRLALTYLSL
jgi:digeranylgeranylglycerophospholipid reductase